MPGPLDITAEVGESHRPEMLELASTFYHDIAQLGRLTPVAPADMPDGCQSILAHDDHMTVTLEAFHESLMKLIVLEEDLNARAYTRKSILARQTDGEPLQLGVMRIYLAGLPDKVRQQIEGHSAPLGRVLIRNNLLREVELLALWRVDPAEELRGLLNLGEDKVVYGRSARILVDGRPAVEVLEIAKT